jgi:hypothetical protein
MDIIRTAPDGIQRQGQPGGKARMIFTSRFIEGFPYLLNQISLTGTPKHRKEPKTPDFIF